MMDDVLVHGRTTEEHYKRCKLCLNIGLVSWIRDVILSSLVTIIKHLVHHAVYCIILVLSLVLFMQSLYTF